MSLEETLEVVAHQIKIHAFSTLTLTPPTVPFFILKPVSLKFTLPYTRCCILSIKIHAFATLLGRSQYAQILAKSTPDIAWIKTLDQVATSLGVYVTRVMGVPLREEGIIYSFCHKLS